MLNKIKKTFQSYNFRYYNYRLVILALALSMIGILAIASATDSDMYEQKQTMGLILGLVVMVVVSFIDYKFILKFSWCIYILNLVLLLAVAFFGSENMGAQRWIEIGGFQLQPSELTKIFMILFLGWFLNRRQESINHISTILSAIILMGIPAVLVFSQPDLSTTIVITLTFCAIMYISGLSMKIISGVIAVAVPCFAILVFLIMQPDQQILHGYQYDRIVGFYDESNTAIRYQQEHSILAIGSGGLTGKGLNNNTITSVKNGNFLSQHHTDFIFSIIGEELGFIGASAVVVLLFLLILECFRNGSHAPDLAGRIISVAYGALIGVQSMINLAVATMLMPNTGLTLPFVSYGLSSLVSLFIGIGIILNIGIQRDIDDID